MFRAGTVLALVAWLGVAANAAQQPARGTNAAETIAHVGTRVVEWYARAQNIVSTEDVRITPLRYDMSPAESARRLSYELRVAWESDGTRPDVLPEPTILRSPLTVNGRPPRPGSDPGCMDPKPVTPEPLMMFLPGKREDFIFTHAGTARIDGRLAVTIDYKSILSGKPDIEWTKECVSVSLPGRTYGRVWIDPSNFDVLRLDEHLSGLFEFTVPREQQRLGAPSSMAIERSDSSIRYRRVQFHDPEDTLMLPAEVETTTVVRGGGTRRTRISQRFSAYRRFITDVRMLP